MINPYKFFKCWWFNTHMYDTVVSEMWHDDGLCIIEHHNRCAKCNHAYIDYFNVADNSKFRSSMWVDEQMDQ